MKVKKLPKVLALHLKRFKYTEDYSRLQKLFHRVVYPYHLRMFNTTDDAEDPDRMYELYAVVVHIGGNAYHGHYVAVIKTKDRGWLLFDDEMVEPVDKHFVRNFFGDKPGMACAYVLFYQETTFEKVREEMDAEGVDQVKLAAQAADLATATEATNGSSSQIILSKLNSQPLPAVDENETLAALDKTKSAPTEIDTTNPSGQLPPPLSSSEVHPLVAAPPPGSAVMTEADKTATSPPKSKDQIAREKKELKAREKAEDKARKAAEKEQARVVAKERLEAQQKMRETARLEREQFNKAIQESKQMAAEEEKRQKKEGAVTTDTATSSDAGGSDEHHWNGFLNRSSRTSKSMARKSMTRKSFAFLHIGQNKDEDKSSDAKADKTDRTETNGENRVDKGESSAGGGENGAPHYQNGSSNSIGPAGKHLLPRAIPRSDTAPGAITQLGNHGNHDREKDKEKDNQKPPLKERFSFGLGKKKSSKFLSSS